MNEYTCHSGGADGSDSFWESEAKKYGVKTIAYSFEGHHIVNVNRYNLNDYEIVEGWSRIIKADETLKRNPSSNIKPYIHRLLCRNWFQVKHSDGIFAIGEFTNDKKTQVKGGTGWAVQMGIDNNKDVYVFEQSTDKWYRYWNIENKFLEYYTIPVLPKNFAGIGTRGLTSTGQIAIKEIYEYNFSK
jgi:hypothetical protein